MEYRLGKRTTAGEIPIYEKGTGNRKRVGVVSTSSSHTGPMYILVLSTGPHPSNSQFTGQRVGESREEFLARVRKKLGLDESTPIDVRET